MANTRENTMDVMDEEMTKLTKDMRSTAASILAGAAPSTRRIPLTKAIRDYSEAIARYFEEEAETHLRAAREDAERFKGFADSIRTQGAAIASELADLLDGTARKMQAENDEG